MSIHVLIPGIEGESSDANNRGLLDVETARFGVHRRITSNTSTRHDRESANAEMSDLYLTRCMDSASPALFLAACCGRGRTIELRCTRTGTGGKGSDTFVAYTLHNAIPSGHWTRARAQGEARPVEILRISFTAMEVKYIPHDANGQALAPLVQGFDTRTNERL